MFVYIPRPIIWKCPTVLGNYQEYIKVINASNSRHPATLRASYKNTYLLLLVTVVQLRSLCKGSWNIFSNSLYRNKISWNFEAHTIAKKGILILYLKYALCFKMQNKPKINETNKQTKQRGSSKNIYTLNIIKNEVRELIGRITEIKSQDIGKLRKNDPHKYT